MNLNYLFTPTQPLQADPRRQKAVRFLMWIYVLSVVMIFAGLTSALLVGKADLVRNQKWQAFTFPVVFWVSTVVILASSVTLHLAIRAARKNAFQQITSYLFATTLLAVVFVLCQVLGYFDMVKQGVYLVGSNSGQFLYVITGAHIAHLVGGIISLIVMLFRSVRYKIHRENLMGLELSATYWHTLDAIWVYLFLFLLQTYS